MKKKKIYKARKTSVKLKELHVKGTLPFPATENLHVNPNNPTHHADIVNVLYALQGNVLLSFYSRTQGFNVEECRISFNENLARALINILCQQINYYPSKT